MTNGHEGPALSEKEQEIVAVGACAGPCGSSPVGG
jgi:hypothetical protein